MQSDIGDECIIIISSTCLTSSDHHCHDDAASRSMRLISRTFSKSSFSKTFLPPVVGGTPWFIQTTLRLQATSVAISEVAVFVLNGEQTSLSRFQLQLVKTSVSWVFCPHLNTWCIHFVRSTHLMLLGDIPMFVAQSPQYSCIATPERRRTIIIQSKVLMIFPIPYAPCTVWFISPTVDYFVGWI